MQHKNVALSSRPAKDLTAGPVMAQRFPRSTACYDRFWRKWQMEKSLQAVLWQLKITLLNASILHCMLRRTTKLKKQRIKISCSILFQKKTFVQILTSAVQVRGQQVTLKCSEKKGNMRWFKQEVLCRSFNIAQFDNHILQRRSGSKQEIRITVKSNHHCLYSTFQTTDIDLKCFPIEK